MLRIVISLFAVLMGQGISQVVHRDHLSDFSIRISTTGNKVFEYKIDRPPVDYIDPMKYPQSLRFSTMVLSESRENEIVTLDSEKILIALLPDMDGFEMVSSVLTFWKINGDSLIFDHYYKKFYESPMSYAKIAKVVKVKGLGYIIVLEQNSSDEGSSNRGYEYLLSDLQSQPKSLYAVEWMTEDGITRPLRGYFISEEYMDVWNYVLAQAKRKYGKQD